jgi:hypothetical protein
MIEATLMGQQQSDHKLRVLLFVLFLPPKTGIISNYGCKKRDMREDLIMICEKIRHEKEAAA